MSTTDRPTDLGINRTGIYLSPIDGPAVVEGARDGEPSSPGSARDLAAVRRQYIDENNPIGHMPPPASLRGVATAATTFLKGQKASVLLDKLGERLAFERTGVRLYDALLAKLEVQGSWERGPTLDELARFRADEARHFSMLQDSLIGLGADPTAVTPSADLVGVESLGLLQAVFDPRTTLAQALHALLVAELVDASAWEQLILLADQVGREPLSGKFREVLAQEVQHRETVVGWLRRHTALAVRGELKYSA